MTTTTRRPSPENITAATLRALASGAFEPGRLALAMELALNPRSCILPDGSVDIPSKSMGFVIFFKSAKGYGQRGLALTPCECNDHESWCKHRTAAALLIRALELEQACKNTPQAPATVPPVQVPAPEAQAAPVPALAPVPPPSVPAPTKRGKVKSAKPAASVAVPPGGIREYKPSMTPEQLASGRKALWG